MHRNTTFTNGADSATIKLMSFFIVSIGLIEQDEHYEFKENTYTAQYFSTNVYIY